MRRFPASPPSPARLRQIPLDGASVDVVTVAQAFHWFDHDPALREIARVLRPGGALALVWNTRGEEDLWVGDLDEVIVGRGELDDQTAVHAPLAASGLFGAVETATFGFRQRSRSRARCGSSCSLAATAR